MKTIIWKELRENLKWSVLALLCLTLAEIYVLSLQRDGGRDLYYNLTVCSSAFLMVTSFGCSVVGAALGAIQILPELRRDQWAALLHRPVTRSVIFFGKVCAGLLLYFLAATPPLLASVAYVAAPGQFPGPLVPGMILPAASDLFLGLTFYFAALLVSLSRGPWSGSRGLLGLSLLPVFVSHMMTRWIFLLPVLASLILMAAAWGAMMSNGLVSDRPKVGRFSFVLVTLVAASTAVILFDLALFLLPSAVSQPPSISSHRDLELTREGKLLVQSWHDDGSEASLTDVHGQPVTDERYAGNNRPMLYRFTTIDWDFESSHGSIDAYLAQHPRNLRNYVEPADSNQNNNVENWYLLTSRNYFAGYDKLSRRCVAICDIGGFHLPGATPKPFPARLESALWNSWPPYLYWSDGQLYGLDFAERSMAPLFNTRSARIHGAELIGANPGRPSYIGVALDKEIRILDLRGNPLLTIPYAHDPRTWLQVSLATVPSADRIFVSYEPQNFLPTPTSGSEANPSFVDEINLQGNILHSSTIPPTHIDPISPSWAAQVATLTLPFGPAALYTAFSRVFPSEDTVIDSIYQLPSLRLPVSRLAILFAVSAALGIFAFVWARKAGHPKEKARLWTAFVFIFGLPGFITFRLAADWPARVRCPICSTKRSLDAEECPGCHAAWAPPERNGTEIFDPAAT